LTVTDNYSRYLLACPAVPQITTTPVQPVLAGLFRSHGQGWPKVPSGVA
jgi:hypothetical protein